MRERVDVAKIRLLMQELGRRANGPGKIYLVGGSTALLLGIRDQTIDVDLKMDPEPAGVFEAIAILKNDLSVNVELAAPDQFLPELPGWRDRSEFIQRSGQIDFFHYDFYAQALSKLLRKHTRDLDDVKGMVLQRKIEPQNLAQFFRSIKNDLIRYPAIDVATFEVNVFSFIEEINRE